MTSLCKTIMSRQSCPNGTPGVKSRTLRPLFRFCASQIAIASLLALAIPHRPALALTEFQVCANELLRADVSPERASVACSQALAPKDLSGCVLRINYQTPTISDEALAACTRVRRPLELASCMVDINTRTEGSDAIRVLDYCRRSLLPVRFSECVIGLSREVDASTPGALDTCIAADDFPRQLFPTLVPPPSANPTPPNIIPSLVPPPTVPIQPNVPLNPLNL